MKNEKLHELIQQNNGVLNASTARIMGFDNKVLQRLEASGELERIGRGLYIDSDYMRDEYLLAQYRCRKGIFSHETALFFHELSDRTPMQLMMTIPNGYNTRIMKDTEHYRFFYLTNDKLGLGITTMRTSYGNEVAVYDKERTICDCIRNKNKLDSDIVVAAVKRYMKEKEANYSKLLNFAETFRIRDAVKQYMEVLT